LGFRVEAAAGQPSIPLDTKIYDILVRSGPPGMLKMLLPGCEASVASALRLPACAVFETLWARLELIAPEYILRELLLQVFFPFARNGCWSSRSITICCFAGS
jgi:hypothetical protein